MSHTADKMKILMLNHEFPPVGGGASPVTYELCKQLASLGHHVDVVTMHYGDTPRFESVDGFNVYRTPAIRRKPDICHTHELATYLPGAVLKTLKLAKKHRYDIIHCHFIVPGATLAWLVSRLTGIPFVVTCHGSDVPGHNPDRFKLMHKLIMPAWRFLVKRTPLIASPSCSLKKKITHNCSQANVKVIPNGIYPEQFRGGVKTKSILMCSRIFEFKGFQYAIEAFKDIPSDWTVDIIGTGPYLDELKALAESLGVSVNFVGWLDKSDPEFYRYFSRASIFIFPSEAENFPSVLLEAMSASTAIITCTAGGCPEVVGDAAILVPPRNADAIRQNLLKLIDDEDIRLDLAAKAAQRVLQFDWGNIVARYIEAYRSVTDGREGK